jgi:uncharacterized membrane protein
MNNQTLLHAGLVLHIIGISTLAGVTLASYITSRQFRMHYGMDKKKGFAILQATSKFSIVTGIGLLLLVVSGMLMFSATGGLMGKQIWFRVKMIFVLLIIAESRFLKRMMEKRLRIWVDEDIIHNNRTTQIEDLVSRIGNGRLLLLFAFVIIFILSVFRFN